METRTKNFLIFCAPIAVVMAVMFLPLLLLLIFAQVIYEISLVVLNAILPSTLNTIAFGYGAGMLKSGIGLTFTWIFILARHIVDLILRFKIFFNVVMLGLVSCYYYVDGFVFSNPFHTLVAFYDWFDFGTGNGNLTFLQYIGVVIICTIIVKIFGAIF
jgi:hypothetical protein